MKCPNCNNQLTQDLSENDERLQCNQCDIFYHQRWLVYVNTISNEYHPIYTHIPFDKNPHFPIGEWECCGSFLIYEDAMERLNECFQKDLQLQFDKLCDLYPSHNVLLFYLIQANKDLESDGYISDQTRRML